MAQPRPHFTKSQALAPVDELAKLQRERAARAADRIARHLKALSAPVETAAPDGEPEPTND